MAKTPTIDGIVHVKPLSVNVCWQGARRKSYQYLNYETKVLSELPEEVHVPEEGELMVYIQFAHSNKAFDWDNGIKPFQDILQKKYNFNDRRVYFAIVEKTVVKKGEEYVYFRIKKMSSLDKLRKYIKEIFK